MGMAAGVVQLEDIVYVLLRSRFNMVLRPIKNEGALTFV